MCALSLSFSSISPFLSCPSLSSTTEPFIISPCTHQLIMITNRLNLSVCVCVLACLPACNKSTSMLQQSRKCPKLRTKTTMKKKEEDAAWQKIGDGTSEKNRHFSFSESTVLFPFSPLFLFLLLPLLTINHQNTHKKVGKFTSWAETYQTKLKNWRTRIKWSNNIIFNRAARKV